ncbi:hypothetical protein WA026_005719 [Henosepilachna vigintioctopunctata]|uniref:Uncharacterized protein n=1 Tax=Henosepilachna vigintioctopunctata TaxID=420089 RepID=A0AAW1U6A9_9CUCU
MFVIRPSENSTNKTDTNCFNIESVTDTQLLKLLHSQTSDERHSRFLSDSSVDTSATQCPNTTAFVSVDNLSKSNLNSSKRRTFEIQKSVIDSPLLVTNSTTSNGRDYKDPVMLKRRDTYELEESVADYKDPVMNKRLDTYELEESVAGMNILRTLSDSTFTDIGVDVLPRENSVDFSTSKKVNYENITRRTLLDKPTKELEVANGHNSLINKSSKRVCFKNSTSKKRSMSLDKPFLPTTFTSSMPKCVFQSSSAQKSINTGKHLPLSRRRSKSADQGNTRITGIRMPNFAKIHQKAREKMENIVQLTERKAERAKLLLSGQKPNDSRDVLNSDNNARDVKRSHKQLTFDSSKPSTSRGFLRVYQGNAKKEQLKVASTEIPVFNEIKSELSKDIGLKVAVPEKHKNAEKTRQPKATSLKKITQFGFKIRSDSCSENKLDQIKALAAKTKLQQDNRAEQRSILKGVRSNKRFELLMKMRKK